MSLNIVNIHEEPHVDIAPSGLATHPFNLQIDMPLDSVELNAKSLEVLRDLGARINELANALTLAQKHQPKGD